MTAAITRIERARGFLEAAQLSADWVREMGDRALILEAHHTTHIEYKAITIEASLHLGVDSSDNQRRPETFPLSRSTAPSAAASFSTIGPVSIFESHLRTKGLDGSMKH